MRRLIGLLSLATVIGAATAANQDDATASRAYLGFSFGGATLAPRDFHYGLRLDYDNVYETRPSVPMMQFDFTTHGLAAAQVNGLSVLKKAYRLQQNENPAVPTSDAAAPAEAPPAEAPPADAGAPPADAGAPAADAGAAPADAAPADAAAAPSEVPAAEAGAEAAPAEQPGFFARSWHGIKNFFGMGDQTEVAKTEAKPAEQPADKPAEGPKENPDDVAQGTFMSYNVIDWATLAVGAVGLGAVVSEVSQHDQSNDSGSTTTTGSTTGAPVLPTGAVSVLPTGGITGGLTGGFAGSPEARQMSKELKERLEWLDGGTGHMGDLEPAKN